MVPRVQMNRNPLAANGVVEDDAQPSTSGTTFGNEGYIRRIGGALGITASDISEKAVQEVNNNVTYVLRTIIAGSQRFANHSRRTRILPEDVDSHLALERKPTLFGFKPREMIALRLAGSGGKEIFVEDDKELELKPIYTAAAPKVPPIPSVRSHWLAIDGEQPAVPENPIPIRKKNADSSAEVAKEEEAQEEANRLLNIVRGNKSTEHVNVKTTTTHTLSLEQQVYYKEITEAIMGNDDQKRTEALHSLKTDAGIQPLVGRFSVAVAEGVRCNIVQHNLAFLIYLMRLVQSLVNNSTISLDKWLHEFLPSVLSCILSRQVCTRPETDNHWALREFSGRLLVDLCRKHEGPDIQSRIIKVLTRAWVDHNASMATIYGSLYTLDHFGPETIRSVVIPMIPSLYNRVQSTINDRTDHSERIAADKLNSYTTKILVNYIRTMRPVNLTAYQDYVDLLGGYAENVYRVVSADVPTARVMPGRTVHSTPKTIQSFQRGGATFSTRGNRTLTNGSQQVRYTSNNISRGLTTNTPGSTRPPL